MKEAIVRWLTDPDGWHSYTVYADGNAGDGPGVISNMWVFVGGTTAPGISITPDVYAVNPGFYFWPVIEAYSQSGGYGWASAAIDPNSVDSYNPNWCYFAQ